MQGITKLSTGALLVLGTFFIVPVTQADQFDDSGLYLGASYGLVSVDGEDFEDESGFPQIYAGLQILPFLGIEGTYYDFGDYGNALFQADVDAYSLAVTGRLPVSETLAIFAKLGPMWSQADIVAGPFTTSRDSEELMIGAGVSFEVAENLDLRISYDWVDQDLGAGDIEGIGSGDFNSDLNLFAAGLKLEF